MLRTLLILTSLAAVLVTGCTTGGRESASPSSTARASASSSEPPRAAPGDGEHIGTAGVVLAVDQFRVVNADEDERCKHEGQIARAPSGTSCLAIDYTLRSPTDLAGVGVGRFPSYIDPTGQRHDSADVATTPAGSEQQTTWLFPAAPGGTLYGEVGVKDGDRLQFQVHVPNF